VLCGSDLQAGNRLRRHAAHARDHGLERVRGFDDESASIGTEWRLPELRRFGCRARFPRLIAPKLAAAVVSLPMAAALFPPSDLGAATEDADSDEDVYAADFEQGERKSDGGSGGGDGAGSAGAAASASEGAGDAKRFPQHQCALPELEELELHGAGPRHLREPVMRALRGAPLRRLRTALQVGKRLPFCFVLVIFGVRCASLVVPRCC
jgi:hypothetical protein